MFEERISLCLTVEGTNKSVYLLRIADYFDGEMVPFPVVRTSSSTNNIESVYDIPTISVSPRITEAGELCVWRWQPRENDPDKQISYKTTISFWCLIVSPEAVVDIWDKDNVIKTLKNGFSIPSSLPESFLLKVWEGKDTLRVIYLLKNDLAVFENRAKLLDSTDKIKLFEIPKKDFFKIDNRYDNRKTISQLLRYHASTEFYKFSELPGNFEILPAKTFDETLLMFIKFYAKAHNVSRNDRNVAKELLMDFISNKDYIKESFVKFGYHDDRIDEKIEEIKSLISEFIAQDGSANLLVAAMAENIPLLKEKYIQYIRDEWFSQKDDERIKIEDKLNKIVQQLENAISDCKKVCETKKHIEQSITNLNNEKNELEKQISEFQKSFDAKIRKARQEIGDFLADVAIYQGIVGNSIAENRICRFVSELSNDQDYKILEEINDVLYLLEKNLAKAGIIQKYVKIASQQVICCFLSGRPLLVVGYNARSFANALSATLFSLPADVLTLPVSFRSAHELKNALDESKSNVVLIENAVLGCDESVYLPLVKGKSKKLLLFSVDFEDNMALLPKSILHYMNLIDLDLISEDANEQSCEFGLITKELSVLEISDDQIYRYRKILKNVSKACGLSSIYIHQRSEHLAMFDVMNGKALVTLLVCELVPYFIAQGRNDEIEEFITELRLPDNEQKLIDDIIAWK